MERIVVHAKFHTGHRQLGYPGKCRFVHGHTWRGTIRVECDEFPRDELDMALDFGDLKKIMRQFDHKMIVVPGDKAFNDPEIFEQEGVVVIPGKGPSVENVAAFIYDGVVAHITEKYPDHGIAYTITVEIQETENNFFAMEKSATV
ncbi:6-carboxytetrahydropterin synthase [bacterium]|nr:6-carboxytetrahydropterin synthase [bacterium]